jgi:hypothetical protein
MSSAGWATAALPATGRCHNSTPNCVRATGIPLSFDAVLLYLGRYQTMLAARQQGPQQLARAYARIASLVLSIDGVQPEKGHETLYTVREYNARRIWFAESLLSSNQDEVRRLLVRAHEWARRLGKPVRLWLSDKQDAFVSGIALEFPNVPHRYCDNHFLRDLAKPMLDSDSTAKVQMRKKVRGLRQIEREVLKRRQVATPQVQSRNDVEENEASPSAVARTAAGDQGAATTKAAKAAKAARHPPTNLRLRSATSSCDRPGPKKTPYPTLRFRKGVW